MQVGGENGVLKAQKAAGCQKHEPTPEPETLVGMSESPCRCLFPNCDPSKAPHGPLSLFH